MQVRQLNVHKKMPSYLSSTWETKHPDRLICLTRFRMLNEDTM